MNYNKFTIENFRCFSTLQTLTFAKPIENKVGSGITYIVGGNNSGKTTLIEAIWMKDGAKIKGSERQKYSPIFSLYDNTDQLKRQLQLIRPESHTLIENPKISLEDELFEVITSRRHWESAANDTGTSKNFLRRSIVGDTPRKSQDIRVASIMKDIEADDKRYNEFIGLVQKVIPEFTKWAVGYEDHEYIEYISQEGIRHKTDFLGDGVISVIRILAHLFENTNCGLIIDEPELSLHPMAQRRLAAVIGEYSKNRQIIVSTHSPFFINWEYLINGAKLNRVVKKDDTDSKIYTLQPANKYMSLLSGANWQQPFLLDVVSKEIFFAGEKILFLEGQEDVGLLRGEFVTNDVTLFGYGVRGFQNFKVAMQMAKDLGFAKVGTIIDGGEDEKDLAETLKNEFDQYKIIQWNKLDIRDKTARTLEDKEGYFTEDGKLKKDNQLDDYKEKLQELKKYFEDYDRR